MSYYDWTKYDPLPRKDLEAWYQYVPGQTGNYIFLDNSGNNRHISASSGNQTYLVANVLNEQAAMYFPGNQSPLVYSGSTPTQHIFCVASFEDATFSGSEGLMSATSTYGLLIGGGAGTTKFYDIPELAVSSYKKNGVSYANNNMLAPMSQQVSIIEMKLPSAFSLAGVQIGQDRADTGRKWKGYFFEALIYSSAKNDNELKRIYEYFAMRYQIWRKNSAGLNIFPFVADRSRGVDRELEHYLSEPYSGSKKALIRDIKRELQLPFSVRHQAEFEAAESFHQQHYPLTDFIYEDYKYYPFKPRTLNFTSSLKEQGSDVSYRFNYAFDAIEA